MPLPLLLALTVSGAAQAQQVLNAEDGRDMTVEIPARGLTMFKTEGAKLLKVRHVQGELAIEADSEKGEVTVRPLKSGGVAALFLVTETATIPINVRIDRNGIGAKSVVLRVPSPPAAALPVLRPKRLQGPAQEYVRAIKNMVIAAAAANLDESSYEVVMHNGKALPPLDALHVLHQATISSAAGLSARKYIITNPTDKRIAVDERKFRAPDALAVAVEHAELEPGGATVAVVVSLSGD